MELDALMRYLVDTEGSDLYVKVGSVPHVRVDGSLRPSVLPAPQPADTEALATQLLAPHRLEELARQGEIDVAHGVPGLGRFRVHVYSQRGSLALAVRRVLPGIPPLERLGLPPVVARLAGERRGIVLVTGPAASGRSTTLAALVDLVNQGRAAHVVTIEDPVEYLHEDRRSIISQREVGTDVHDIPAAVRRALRQAPDVLAVGDVADRATMDGILDAARTGLLVFAVLSTAGAAAAIERVLELYPVDEQHQVRVTLASVLRGVISQRLLERADGQGRIAAAEILVATAKVHDCLVGADPSLALERVIVEGEYHGMQSLDQALFGLCADGLISLREALGAADDADDLRLRLERAGLAVA